MKSFSQSTRPSKSRETSKRVDVDVGGHGVGVDGSGAVAAAAPAGGAVAVAAVRGPGVMFLAETHQSTTRLKTY
ncbi:hypothetical protein RUM44_005099 [Polyplax serrata]|uniref:Uncharacterized protein n=1 Tax=Polyplax serrata TaxID=468196 RepID=A0ABR1AE41_POLSC